MPKPPQPQLLLITAVFRTINYPLSMEFAINLRSLLLLLAMVQGLVIAGAVVWRYYVRGRIRDLFFGLLLLYLVLSLVCYFIGFLGVYDYAREAGWDLTFFPFGNVYLYGPLIWLYVSASTDSDYRWRAENWLHFLLPALYYGISLWCWSLPMEQKDSLEAGLLGPIDTLIAYLSLAVYTGYSFRRWRTFQFFQRQEYARNDQKTERWLLRFLLVFSGYLLFDLAFSICGNLFNFWYTEWYWLHLSRAGMLYYLSVMGWAFVQNDALPIQLLSVREEEGRKNLFPEEELPLRIARLRSFMEQEKAYLNPDLTLTELAQQTGMNTAQLSFVINNGLGKNFNDFINQYRVEAVKSSLQDPSLAHLSLLGVAFECGFNSKTTFNRAFKKLTGNAPSGYLVRLAKDPQSCTN